MGKLITVVGNSGVGKTALTQRLCQLAPFTTGMEQHAERPFQQLFSQDHARYSLANQIDYLLLRAEQELAIRQSASDGILDGGLDQDYYIFTHLFFKRGYLNPAEFALCQRLYNLLRSTLPPPDVIIWLVAPLAVIERRFAQRGRLLEIATLADLQAMQALLEDWLGSLTGVPVIQVDASLDDPGYIHSGESLLAQLSDYN